MKKSQKHTKHKRIMRKESPHREKKQRNYSRFFPWYIVMLVILLIAAIRIRLLSIPLERDEGEFAYMGQLILQGIPPYLLAYNMKLPGIYVVYALIMAVFGQTIAGIHIGFLLVNAATIIMVFLLTRRLLNSSAAVIASATFAILSVSPGVLGTSAHATHFVLLPALAGILLMLKAIETNEPMSFFWSGILLGLSFIVKQQGLLFCTFAFLYTLATLIRKAHSSLRPPIMRTCLFLIGVITPFLVTCMVLFAVGVFERFWFWTFLYAYQYGTSQSFADGMDLFSIMFPKIIGNFYLLWLIAGIGMIALFLDRDTKSLILFLLGFLLFSFLAVCPGFYFRGHYFILLLPATAILSAVAINSSKKLFIHLPGLWILPELLFLMVFLHGLFLERTFFFNLNPVGACRAMYSINPFPESLEIAKYIKEHSVNTGLIAVLGSEPQIYFYSQRHSATGYIYTYGLMEDQKYALTMQKDLINEIERNKPEYIVFVKNPLSWLNSPHSERLIFNWFKEYRKNYILTGIVDTISSDKIEYRWDSEIQGYYPQSPNVIFVFKRNIRDMPIEEES